jgi:hypothetical protein
MASVTGASSALFSTSAHPAVVHAAAHGGPLSLSSATFAGGGSAGGVVATQTHEGGNTVIHLEDGSTITVVGVTHFDSSFVH